MSCENNVCGTGGWGGPQPGDPDNNITLHARTVYGGIMVSWSYPLINPHAVAYTDVYRGTSEDYATAVLLEHAGGSSYLDKVQVTSNTDYFYWVEVVSIHGTRGERIGPVMATAEPLSRQTLETLTGLIDSGILSEALRQDIGGITLTNQAIYQEIQDRLASNAAFQTALASVQNGLADSMTFIGQEITQRQDADSAFVSQLDIIAAAVDDAMAAILEEKTIRLQDSSATVEQYNALYAEVQDAKGAIVDIKTLNIDPTTALATNLSTLRTDVDGAASAVQELDTSLANGTHALAQKVTTVEVTLNGDSATGQMGLAAKIDQETGRVSAIWTAMTLVNGLAGGFGIANDGTIVEAGFDVDRFWIGRTGIEKIKPFIIDGDVVYIDKARIREADIDTLKIAGNAVTTAVSAYSAGRATINPGSNTVQTLTFQSSGAPVLIGFGCAVDPPGYSTDGPDGTPGGTVVVSQWNLALYRDGVQLFTCDGPVTATNQGMRGNVYFQIQDAPGAGNHTYTLCINSLDSQSVNGGATSRIINALEVKR
jgi:hypothetical protein